MIESKEFRTLCIEISAILANLTETSCFTAFSFRQHQPAEPGQFWEYELSFIEADETAIQRPIGYFVGLGKLVSVQGGRSSEKPLSQFSVRELTCQRFAIVWGNREQKHPKKIEPPASDGVEVKA